MSSLAIGRCIPGPSLGTTEVSAPRDLSSAIVEAVRISPAANMPSPTTIDHQGTRSLVNLAAPVVTASVAPTPIKTPPRLFRRDLSRLVNHLIGLYGRRCGASGCLPLLTIYEVTLDEYILIDSKTSAAARQVSSMVVLVPKLYKRAHSRRHRDPQSRPVRCTPHCTPIPLTAGR
jgi:hypothetical protein